MTTARNAIVVGISADGSDAALAFAVAEANRTGCPLHLIHVLMMPAGHEYADLYDGVRESGDATLAEAMATAKDLAGTHTAVTGEVVDNGWTIDDLVRGSTGHPLLVLQHRALTGVHRLFAGSIVRSVAGRSHVPVVSVPEGWAPRTDRPNVVIAAVQDAVEAPALLRVAFEAARARGASLVVMHAWWLASGYDVVVVDGAFRAQWTDQSRRDIAPVLAPLRSEFPDVPVEVDVRHAPPVEAVLDAAETCDLIVLGRRHHLLPLGSHLGPVARAALGHATTPVMITPELDNELVTATKPVPQPQNNGAAPAPPVAATR